MRSTPGSYGIHVVAELAGKQVQSTVTFAVVEPFQVQTSNNPQPVAIVGPTKVDILVDVLSAVPNGAHYDVELTSIPSGWELEGSKLRHAFIDRKNGRTVTRFGFKLPLTTPAGDYTVGATVTWRAREWQLKQLVRVIRTDEPKPSAGQ